MLKMRNRRRRGGGGWKNGRREEKKWKVGKVSEESEKGNGEKEEKTVG